MGKSNYIGKPITKKKINTCSSKSYSKKKIFLHNILQKIISFLHRNLKGFVYLTHLTQKLVSQNFKLTEPVDKVLFKQFQKVRNDTVLGLIGRILEKDDFVAVLNETGHCKGVINKLDFLTFVAKGKSVESVQNGHSNGVKNGK